MSRSSIRSSAAVIALAGALGSAHGTVNTFTGADDGVGPPGPWVNSAAAEASFMGAASAYGTLSTATFEGLPVGFFASFNALPGLTVSQSGVPYGDGSSGVSDVSSGTLFGFNVTTGGNQFLGMTGDTTTLAFAGGTNAVGFYLTGLQTYYTTSLVVSFNDGTTQTLSIPVNTSGGASYFGFTDTAKFASVTLVDNSTGSGVDIWGIDNVTFAASVPEPSSAVLALAGLAVVAGWAARRRQQ